MLIHSEKIYSNLYHVLPFEGDDFYQVEDDFGPYWNFVTSDACNLISPRQCKTLLKVMKRTFIDWKVYDNTY
jgi:hypothetical protein